MPRDQQQAAAAAPPSSDAAGEMKRRIHAAIEGHGGMTAHEARVDVCMRMMASGNWVSGLSHQMLAEAWGVKPSAVFNYATQASQHIKALVRLGGAEERESLLAQLVQNVERLAQKAEARGSRAGYRDALEANKFLAQLLGLVTHKVEVDDRRSPFEGWTTEELEHFSKTGERPKRRIP